MWWRRGRSAYVHLIISLRQNIVLLQRHLHVGNVFCEESPTKQNIFVKAILHRL
jgi:hypothetical protein